MEKKLQALPVQQMGSEGLHDTYFLRAMYFADKQKTVQAVTAPHRKDDHTYLIRRQRGELLGLQETSINRAPSIKDLKNPLYRIGGSDISSKLGYSLGKKSLYDVGKTDIASKLGYSPFTLPVSYSGNSSSSYKPRENSLEYKV